MGPEGAVIGRMVRLGSVLDLLEGECRRSLCKNEGRECGVLEVEDSPDAGS